MGPAELLDYDRQRLRGLVLEEGGSASHVAIVARALGIAAISQAKGVLDAVEPGDAAIVDAEGGELHVRPTPEVVSAYADKVRFRARRQAQYAALRNVPAVTLDGAAGVAATSMPASCSTCRISISRAPTASACSAPSCNS